MASPSDISRTYERLSNRYIFLIMRGERADHLAVALGHMARAWANERKGHLVEATRWLNAAVSAIHEREIA